MTGAPRITGASVHFEPPARVVVEASMDAMHDQDIAWDERFDAIEDVIRIEWRRTEVEITTCRTIARPWRENIVIPRSCIERLIY